MALPSVNPERIDEALARFDRDDRALPDWQGWEQRGNYKYAIAKNGLLYPPKEIVSLATGVRKSDFGGGAEANEYLRRHGFKIEALNLPTEGEVQTALHDLLVMKAPSPVEPSDAYRMLADQFALPEHLRARLMANSGENHWQNRVRFARRKLVDAGIVDRAEYGRWRLVLRPRPTVWIEKSIVKGRPDRAAGDHALGRALWSPIRAQNGADIYRNMRLVQPNDIVLHLTDNAAFTGRSIADGFARTDFVGVEGTNWAGLPCYRISLRDFTLLNPPLARNQLVANSEIRKRLVDIRRAHPNLFYDPNLELHQGGYLTEAPERLVSLLDSLYHDYSGRYLFGTLVMHDELPAPSIEQRSSVPQAELQPLPRVWLYAPGPQAAYWDEFRALKIAGIGWDQLGDLSDYNDAEAVKTRMDQLSSQPESLINANQCFDFSHRMALGDRIFVKKGRREIIGFGIVKSDYRFEPDRPYYKNVRHIEWQRVGSWPTASHRMLSMKTITDITDDETLVDELDQLVSPSEPLSAAPSTTTLLPEYTVEDFSSEAAISQETIQTWLSRLKRKQQVIFQGPPGTGKTFVAERLARLLTANTYGMVETVQFHPSYGYEDFMHGIRPVLQDGQMTFERMPGRFLMFCRRARSAQSDAPCVLIIDEINRANLSRVFGELMYLLEYREKAIPLAGEESLFGIPPNVYIIGTMNTADRSIAVVDHALRRRFSFTYLAPDYDTLRSHLEMNGLVADDLIRALQLVNAAIDDRNYEIGISFFLKDGAALRFTLRDVWEGEIEPYLEEYFYDQPSKLEPLRWNSLSSSVLASWNAAQ